MSGPKSLTLAFFSGCLLALPFPPIDLSLYAWIGFVPLLWLIREHAPKRAFLLGWTSGMGFYLCTVYWVVHTIGLYSNIPTVVAVGPLLMMCAILAFYTGLFAAGLRFAQHRGGTILLIGPPLWVTCEWLRSFFFIGFPWLSLGYSQHPQLDLIQFVEFTSVYGLSALVMFGNLTLFTCWKTTNRQRMQLLATALLVIFGLAAWGSWRRAQIAALPPAHHLRVGLIQGNIPQETKWHPNATEETMSRYERLTREAVARGANLVIWPETAAPFYFQAETLPDAAYRERLFKLATAVKTPILFGSPAFKISGLQDVTLFNRAYLMSANAEIVDSYDKIRLAPFGEYIPFHSILFFLDKLVVGIGDFAAGTEQTVFSLPQARFSVLICYEGIFPSLARGFVGRGAELLVNITNDAWFGRSSAPYQHLMMEAMRAVENRVPLVRAANTGFSAVVDLDGRVRSRTNLYETTLIVEDLSWPRVSSFYAMHGDVFAWLCVVSSSLMLGYCYFRHP